MNRPWLHQYGKGVPATLEYPEITLPQFLADTAARHPDHIATTLSDIEKALVKHLGVKDAGVVGAPDPIRGESIVAFVVMEEGAALDREDLFRHCRQHLAEFKVPRRIVQRDDIPCNRVGKPLRRILREEV